MSYIRESKEVFGVHAAATWRLLPVVSGIVLSALPWAESVPLTIIDLNRTATNYVCLTRTISGHNQSISNSIPQTSHAHFQLQNLIETYFSHSSSINLETPDHQRGGQGVSLLQLNVSVWTTYSGPLYFKPGSPEFPYEKNPGRVSK